MAKGRNALKAKSKPHGSKPGDKDDNATPAGPLFVELKHDDKNDVANGSGLHQSTLLMTLLFHDKHAQYKALARIEAFYESFDPNARQYLTLDEASQARVCRDYEAFNFPLSAVHDWLAGMRARHQVDATPNTSSERTTDQPAYWSAYTNDQENYLLAHLVARGCLSKDDQTDKLASSPSSPSSSASGSVPQYLVSAVASYASSSLPHEQLHFLYFYSSDYRTFVEQQYDSLSRKTRKVIELDLQMRKYAQHVWQDEFQAYVALNAAEFGQNTLEECAPIQTALRTFQHTLWQSLDAPPATTTTTAA